MAASCFHHGAARLAGSFVHGEFKNLSSSALLNNRCRNFLLGRNMPRSINRLTVIGETSRYFAADFNLKPPRDSSVVEFIKRIQQTCFSNTRGLSEITLLFCSLFVTPDVVLKFPYVAARYLFSGKSFLQFREHSRITDVSPHGVNCQCGFEDVVR